jgi:hypothetical protein
MYSLFVFESMKKRPSKRGLIDKIERVEIAINNDNELLQ